MITAKQGSFIATSNITNAGSAAHNEPLFRLFNLCRGGLEGLSCFFLYGDKPIRVQPHWVRDYALSLKGFRYTESDVTSYPDLLLERQTPKGFFFEILAPVTDIHSGVPRRMNELGEEVAISPDECHLLEPGMKFGFCRLELEADIEYLMVEYVFMVWQIHGDDDYLRLNLPRLEKGLKYIMSDPLRWDEEHGLAKRPRTLDTWDFLDRQSSEYDRAIRPDDPMGLFHGDNTGLYNAKLLMARMYRVIGDEPSAKRHEEEAAALRERIMKYLWNGTFFSHFLPLTNVDYGVDEKFQMSLSNSYALNRQILTQEQRLSVLNAYRAMKDKYQGEYDDFRNLEPPYPVFKGRKAGEYVNGAVAPFVAGQLAVAAFELGEEEYGVDILMRIGKKVSRDGKFVFLWDWEGKDIGGGPRCWSSAEILNAECTGLAGVVDNWKLFEDVTLSPRFAAAHEEHARVRLEYPASGACVEYDFKCDYAERKMTFELMSSHRNATVRLYVPKGCVPCSVASNGIPVPFEIEAVRDSRYAIVKNVENLRQLTVCYNELP